MKEADLEDGLGEIGCRETRKTSVLTRGNRGLSDPFAALGRASR
jgi:hypothetical protein